MKDSSFSKVLLNTKTNLKMRPEATSEKQLKVLADQILKVLREGFNLKSL
jgi:hypothetical protein